jgi:hypothetical protein
MIKSLKQLCEEHEARILEFHMEEEIPYAEVVIENDCVVSIEYINGEWV